MRTHVPDCNGVKVQVLEEDRWTISRRLTLPSTSHREREPLDTHASIVFLWVLLLFSAQVHFPESSKAVKSGSRPGSDIPLSKPKFWR